MNTQFNYYPAPGIIYDIIKMLYVKLNSESTWTKTLTPVNFPDDTKEYITKHVKVLPDPKPELALFVYIPTNKHKTLLSSIIDPIVKKDFTSFSIDLVLEYLNDISRIKKEVYAYYLDFEATTSNAFENSVRSCKTITDKIKLLLFGFSYNPTLFISYLRKIIITYAELITEKWSIELPTSEILNSFLFSLKKRNTSKSSNYPTFNSDIINYSICRCTPNYLFCNYQNSNPFFISTSATIHDNSIDTTSYSTSNLLHTLHALDDPYRLEIIKLLSQYNCFSSQEIAKKLNLSLTTTKYHLSLLRKANIIVLNKTGRIVYYYFNPLSLKDLIIFLQNYEKEN